jgi:predicted GTPase
MPLPKGENNMDTSFREKMTSEMGDCKEAMDLIMSYLDKSSDKQINILFAGATGSGKSSTINAIFSKNVAKVGVNVDPETQYIDHYQIGNLTLWDSPGLGDNPDKDRSYANAIAKLLTDKGDDGEYLIDAVVVVLDASSRDMGTTYEMINNLIRPYLGDDKRITIALNKCDAAMSGRHWDGNMPDATLINFLDDKCRSVSDRLNEATGINSSPMFYSSMYNYNISRLLLAIVNSVPDEKRYILASTLNKDPDIWQRSDGRGDYNKQIGESFKISLTGAVKGAAAGATAGAGIGSLIPGLGTAVGAAIGAILGGLGGLFGI